LARSILTLLISVGNLASTYWNQGRWKEAEKLQVLVMGTMKRVFGEEHPHSLTSMGNPGVDVPEAGAGGKRLRSSRCW